MPPKRSHEDNLPSSPVMPPSSPFGDVEEVGFNENDEVIQEDIDDIDELAEEEAGEDLFGDNMEADYRRQGENDRYDGVGIDDEGDYDEMDAADRRRIDERLNRRDAALGADEATSRLETPSWTTTPSRRSLRLFVDVTDTRRWWKTIR